MNKKLILALFLLCNNIQITKPGFQKAFKWLNNPVQVNRWQQLGFLSLIGFLITMIFFKHKEINKLNEKTLDPDQEKVFSFLLYLNDREEKNNFFEKILGNHFKAKVDDLIKGGDNQRSVDLLSIFNNLDIKNSQKYADEITEDHLKSTKTRFEFIEKKIKGKYLSHDFSGAYQQAMFDKLGLDESQINESSVIYKKTN